MTLETHWVPWRPKMMEQQKDLLQQCNNNMETIDNTIMLRNSKPCLRIKITVLELSAHTVESTSGR
jgi:hypothetical protein